MPRLVSRHRWSLAACALLGVLVFAFGPLGLLVTQALANPHGDPHCLIEGGDCTALVGACQDHEPGFHDPCPLGDAHCCCLMGCTLIAILPQLSWPGFASSVTPIPAGLESTGRLATLDLPRPPVC